MPTCSGLPMGRLLIVDRDSTNGTFFYDGEQWRAFARATVQPTARLRFGDCELVASELVVPQAPAPASPRWVWGVAAAVGLILAGAGGILGVAAGRGRGTNRTSRDASGRACGHTAGAVDARPLKRARRSAGTRCKPQLRGRGSSMDWSAPRGVDRSALAALLRAAHRRWDDGQYGLGRAQRPDRLARGGLGHARI